MPLLENHGYFVYQTSFICRTERTDNEIFLDLIVNLDKFVFLAES